MFCWRKENVEKKIMSWSMNNNEKMYISARLGVECEHGEEFSVRNTNIFVCVWKNVKLDSESVHRDSLFWQHKIKKRSLDEWVSQSACWMPGRWMFSQEHFHFVSLFLFLFVSLACLSSLTSNNEKYQRNLIFFQSIVSFDGIFRTPHRIKLNSRQIS